MDRAALPIVFSVSFPAVNGITTYSINLARGLARLGYPTRLLLTEADTLLATYQERPLEIPKDVAIERLAVSRMAGWGAHWGTLVRLLDDAAPCVYMPNADYRHSVVCPRLGPKVNVVGTVHADEPLHYDHVARLGRHWDAIVCVSQELADQLRQKHPELAPRVLVIRNGVDGPKDYPGGRSFEGPLRLVYHGSFKQQQKRVLDFPALLRAVRARCSDATLTLIGSGPDELALRAAARELVAEGALTVEPPVPNDALRERLRGFHVYVLNSEFEGMPQALLEAMSQGCVPVVSDVSSGTREVVRDGENGFLVGISDFGAFADRVATLNADRERLARMSHKAFETLGALGLRVADMAAAYDELIQGLAERSARGASVRTPGPVAEPPGIVGGLSVFLTPLRARHARLGAFPSWDDVTDYEWELFRRGGAGPEVLPVVLAVREQAGGYQAELGIALARRLLEEGRDARLAFLRPSLPDSAAADVPMEIACPRKDAGWAGAAAHMLRLVESHAPCHYVALDRETACLAPGLSSSVRTVVMAGLEDVGWLHASRLLHYLDGVVFSSPDAENLALPDGPPGLTRVSMIRLPVQSLRASPARDGAALSVLVYSGHLDGPALDPAAARALLEALYSGVSPVHVVLAVPRGNAAAMQAALSSLRASHQPRVVEVTGRPGLRPLLAEAHVMVQPGPLADVSLVLLEALGHACVPICVRSPALEETLPGDLGVGLVAEADPQLLAAKVLELGASRERLRDIGEGARASIASRFPAVDDVLDRWIRVLAMVRQATDEGPKHVPGPIFPPYPELSDLSALERKLVRVAGVGAFNHWHEWIEFETRAGMPHRVAMALARWARRRSKRQAAALPAPE